MSEAVHEQSQDNRPPARGSGRLVIALYWIFSATVTLRALADSYYLREIPLWARIIAVLIGTIYVVAAISLTHNGRRMRLLGWCMIALCFIGPLAYGVAGASLSSIRLMPNAWNTFGADFAYLPLVIAAIGAIWMWLSNPRRIVEIAEQVERPGKGILPSKKSEASEEMEVPRG
ncbi:MAG: hypothetical protein KHX93_07590 [Actinomyces sp. oral taxon 181]|nr:hypothetical protein [Actinomyces sp. oral taxon 181]